MRAAVHARPVTGVRSPKNGKTTTTYRRFPKLALVCDCRTHLILSAIVERGPKPDFDHWIPVMDEAAKHTQIEMLLADAGYDAEWIHVAARLVFTTRTIIPPKHGRPRNKLPVSYFRRRMAKHFDRRKYGQRSQVETVFSMIKRRLGSSVNAYGPWSQRRALLLKAVTLNIAIFR